MLTHWFYELLVMYYRSRPVSHQGLVILSAQCWSNYAVSDYLISSTPGMCYGDTGTAKAINYTKGRYSNYPA